MGPPCGPDCIFRARSLQEVVEAALCGGGEELATVHDTHPAVAALVVAVLGPVVEAAVRAARSWDDGQWQTGPRGTEHMRALVTAVEQAGLYRGDEDG
jgi:hypothetical protein